MDRWYRCGDSKSPFGNGNDFLKQVYRNWERVMTAQVGRMHRKAIHTGITDFTKGLTAAGRYKRGIQTLIAMQQRIRLALWVDDCKWTKRLAKWIQDCEMAQPHGRYNRGNKGELEDSTELTLPAWFDSD